MEKELIAALKEIKQQADDLEKEAMVKYHITLKGFALVPNSKT